MAKRTPVQDTLNAMAQNRIALSVDCVMFGYGVDGLKILLLECNLPQYAGCWSLLGDFVRPDEDLDSAAQRVLMRYTHLDDVYLEQVRTFSDAGRHPLGRVVTTAYIALMQISDYHGRTNYDGLDVRWFPVDALPGMAFDHHEILISCMQQMRQNLREQPIGFNLLPRQFTLTQLQALYEVVLGITPDTRNFRRKLRALNVLISTGEMQTDVSHRPAELYTFDVEAYRRRISSGLHFEI